MEAACFHDSPTHKLRNMPLADKNLRLGSLSPKRSVRITRPFENCDSFWIGRCAVRLNESRGTSVIPAGIITGGAGGLSPSEVRLRAFAELVERLSAIVSGQEEAEWSWVPKLPQHPWVKQHEGRISWPKAGERCTWVRGINLETGKDAAVPALLSFLQWRPPKEERIFARPSATGLAAHISDNSAIRNGVLELLERDAAIISWLVPNWPIRALDCAREVPRLFNTAALAGLTLSAYEIGAKDLPPVALVMALDIKTKGLTVGTACHLSLGTALTKAGSEAIILHDTVRRMGMRESQKLETSIDHILNAYRRGPEILSWYDSRSSKKIDSTKRYRFAGLSTLINDAVAALNTPLYAVDVTARKYRETRWRVWRVIGPGALTPSPHGFHYSDHPRVRELTKVRDDRRLHDLPHPFG
jgi:thiazole/oxazole-forming peptide maturase SagD family component